MREDFGKMTFTEYEIDAMIPEGTSSGKGFDSSVSSEEEEIKLAWMHDIRVKLFVQKELWVYMNELEED